MRRALSLSLALALCGGWLGLGCGDDDAMMMTTCPSSGAPVILCEDVDLGCISEGGVALTPPTPETMECGGGPVMVRCEAESGGTIRGGDTTVTCTATNGGGEAQCTYVLSAVETGPLACAGDVRAECAGEGTAVDVPAPMTDATCGGVAGSDAPDTFPLGATRVTFTEAGGRSCSLEVTVEDTAAPTTSCAPQVVLATAPGEVAAPDTLEANDACDPAPATTIEVVGRETPTLARGDNEVVFSATDASGNTAECRTTHERVDAFTPGLRMLSAMRRADGGTTVVVGWDVGAAGPGGNTTGYAIERAVGDGPFERIDEVARGVRTFADDTFEGSVARYRVVPLAETAGGEALEGEPTGEVRAYAIDAAGYDVRGQTVATIPFPTTLYGVVRHPSDLSAGPFPLVLLMHGNHGICRRTPTDPNDACAESQDHECPQDGWFTTPNAEGLAYLAETVAAMGAVAVSISGNAVNCRNTWIGERAQLLRAHLDRWRRYATGSAAPFADRFDGAVDLSRVGLFGHSRGGEAVAMVPQVLAADPVAGVSVTSVLSLAPTDYDLPTPEGVAFATVLPGCDGDVRFLFGTDIYDRAQRTGDGPYAQLLFPGTNHNFFNTEWRLDDDDGSVCRASAHIGAPAQRGSLEGIYGSWLQATLFGAEVEPFVRNEDDPPGSVRAWAGRALDWRWSYAAARDEVDIFEGAMTPDVNLFGGANDFDGYDRASRCFDNDCSRWYPHEKGAVRLDWSSVGPSASFGLGAGYDASSRAVVSLRVVSRRSSLNDGEEQRFTVRVRDASGASSGVRSQAHGYLPHLYDAFEPLEIFQTLRVPLSAFEGVDLTQLTSLEIEMSAASHDTGSVLLSDVAFGD